MKNFLLLFAVLCVFASQVSAQNSVAISPRKSIITIGDTLHLDVVLAVDPKFDASVLLNAYSVPMQNSASVSPSIINYPYSTASTVTFTALKYFKKGTYTVYLTATIGGVLYRDSCEVEVVNTSGWRIFNSIYGELRPTFVTLDQSGTLYNSYLNISGDRVTSKMYSTTIASPNFTGTPYYEFELKQGVFSMLIDQNSIQYFFTGKGVYKLKGSDFTIYNTANSALPSDTVKRGVVDLNGRLWLGTASGLASLENHTITTYNQSNTGSVLGNERITALTVDVNNRLWVGTSNGLVMKDGDTWTRYTPQNSGLPAPYVFSLVADNQGALWMGAGSVTKYFNDLPSYNDCPEAMVGLVKYDGKTWTRYDSTNSPLSSNYVNGMTVDKKGNLWIGTASNIYRDMRRISGCGLLKYDGTTWTSFTTANSPLPDNDVQWVGADRLGNVWFVCKEMFGVMNEDGIPFLVNGVDEGSAISDGISISPNPSNTSFTLSGIDGALSVKILNSIGVEVQQLGHGTTMDVSDLASGVYFVQIRTAVGMSTKPIVVAH